MKKIIILFLLAIFVSNISAQSTTASTNAGGGSNVYNRYLGWDNNTIPLWFKTNGAVRARINNTLTPSGTTAQYTINGFGWSQGVNTSGYVGIGQNLNNVWSNKGPFSMLHLNGEGTFVQELGYRPWMKTGISITSNNDFMYLTNL